MTGAFVRATYRGAMTVAAALAAVGARLPGASRRWPTLAGRLGSLPAAEQAAEYRKLYELQFRDLDVPEAAGAEELLGEEGQARAGKAC